MAYDAFLKIGDLKGESTDVGHKEWLDIYSFSWGASNPTTLGGGTQGLTAGKVSISSLNVMSKVQKTSPVLFLACAKGDSYDTVTLSLRKAGSNPPKNASTDFIKYILSNVFVESVQQSGSSGGDDVPIES